MPASLVQVETLGDFEVVDTVGEGRKQVLLVSIRGRIICVGVWTVVSPVRTQQLARASAHGEESVRLS